MLLRKQKNDHALAPNRILINVNVFGSAGPIRFFVNEDALVATVIDTTLKSYAREGRLPVLGSDFNDFLLYCPSAGADALSPWERIGSLGIRNFMLCKKPGTGNLPEDTMTARSSMTMSRKGSGSWKPWINKPLNLRISSY